MLLAQQMKLATPAGFEPATFSLEVACHFHNEG